MGAGQSGLAAAYYLKKANEDFIILEIEDQAGSSWRNRWDSLRLFTPAQHDSLPGFPFPSARGTLPTKNEMADYLSDYIEKYSLPDEFGTKVIELDKTKEGYLILTSKGNINADNVIVATGTNPYAYIPAFAAELDKNIVQIHSSDYKNPLLFPAQDTLVVGAGTSGMEIAIELSKSRPTMISGKGTPHIPDLALLGTLYCLFIHYILTVSTPIGRKVGPKILNGGAPLISVSMREVEKAGISQLPRLKGVHKGLPLLDDEQTLTVTSIVWATGYRPDFSWIKFEVTDRTGWPKNKRGVSSEYRGLYFVGMVFQFGLTSGLVGGVGRDTKFVVDHLQKAK
ncbi:MAG: NAD(P)/FAD-dependent oxidoreductase [Bacteroidales bacterium]